MKIILIALIVLLILYALFIRVVFNFTFEPKQWINFRRRETTQPLPPEFAAGQEWLHEFPAENVLIQSRDGYTLRARRMDAEHPQRVVIMVHGWHGSWDYGFAPSARWIFGQGSTLILIDQRSQGASGGRCMTFGILESEDCLCWLEWAKKNMPGLPVYLYGISMGSPSVLLAADRLQKAGAAGLISDCGFCDPYEMICHYGQKKFHLPLHPVMDSLCLLFRLKTGCSLKGHDTRAVLKKCTLPVFFAHGLEDRFVPPENAQKNYTAAAGPKRLLLAENAGHCMSFVRAESEYKNSLTRLFDLCEGRCPAADFNA